MHSSIKSSNSYLALVSAAGMGALLFSGERTPSLSSIYVLEQWQKHNSNSKQIAEHKTVQYQ